MICYFVTVDGQSTITGYLRTRGRALAGTVRIVPYEHLPLLRRLPAGSFIFADIERLSAAAAEQAAAVWDALTAHARLVRVLNHPTRSMRRFELLRTLHERGINDADVYRATDLRAPARFPVFVRRANDHAGSLSALVRTGAELVREVDRLTRAGVLADDLIVTEFCDTADANGIYRKYSAFRVGEHIVPRHLLFSRDWAVKVVDLCGAAEVAEELEYVRTNPHRHELMAIFELARIEFGRIDYAVRNGRIQVWEINTNPILGTFDDGGMPARAPVIEHVTPAFAEQLRALDHPIMPPRGVVVTTASGTELLRRRLRLGVEACLRACGLGRYELAITHRLGVIRRRFLG